MLITPNTTNTSFTLPEAGAGLQSISQTTSSSLPTPQAHEVLVRIHAVSLNYRDYVLPNEVLPVKLKPDLVMGSDMAGEIVLVGEGVQNWKVGERITAGFDQGHLYGAPGKSELSFPLISILIRDNRPRLVHNTDHYHPFNQRPELILGGSVDGIFTQYRVFSESGLLRFPKHLSYEEAACWPCAGVTAWNALFGGVKLLPGQTVLCQGTGGVSSLALILANAAGARVSYL